MKAKSSSLYLSDHPLWYHIPPTTQLLLTHPMPVSYQFKINEVEVFSNLQTTISIDPNQPTFLMLGTERIDFGSCIVKFGYEALEHIDSIDVLNPSQALLLLTGEVKHGLVFKEANAGLAWHKALLLLLSKINEGVEEFESEPAAIYDLRPLPKVSQNWQEFEVTLVSESENLVGNLVVDFKEDNLAGALNEFLISTGKTLALPDVFMLTQLLQNFNFEEKLVNSSVAEFYFSLIPFTPQPVLTVQKEYLNNFKDAQKKVDRVKTKLQLRLKLIKFHMITPEEKFKQVFSALHLQKLAMIMESSFKAETGPMKYRSTRIRACKTFLGQVAEVNKKVQSARSSHRKTSLRLPGQKYTDDSSLVDSDKKDCNVF